MAREDNAGLNVRTNYGVREIDGGEDGGKYPRDSGNVSKCEWVFDYTDVNSGGSLTAARNYNGVKSIPAGSFILSATLQVKEAFTSGGSATLDLGLVEADGTAIDADGIDAGIALGAINAANETVLCDGALVGALAGIGAADGQLICANGTAAFTAGKAVLEVEYRKPSVRS